jgi:hypothetical protein
MLPSSSGSKRNSRNYLAKIQPLLAAYFLLDILLAHISTLKMEAIRASETSANFYRTTQCYIPEDNTLYSYRWFNVLWIYLWIQILSMLQKEFKYALYIAWSSNRNMNFLKEESSYIHIIYMTYNSIVFKIEKCRFKCFSSGMYLKKCYEKSV